LEKFINLMQDEFISIQNDGIIKYKKCVNGHDITIINEFSNFEIECFKCISESLMMELKMEMYTQKINTLHNTTKLSQY